MNINQKWDFEEAIQCFKTIDTCLRCIYEGEKHMHRPLSVQLRILLCDKSNKSKPLLLRLIPNFELQQLINIRRVYVGSKINKVNNQVLKNKVSMPFEIRRYSNGVEDCYPLLGKELISLEEWAKQVISFYPEEITVEKLIKKVANRGGGAHVHTSVDPFISNLRKVVLFDSSLDELLLLAIAKVMQKISFSIIQMYEQEEYSLPLKNYNNLHPSIVNASKVHEKYLNYSYQVANLLL